METREVTLLGLEMVENLTEDLEKVRMEALRLEEEEEKTIGEGLRFREFTFL